MSTFIAGRRSIGLLTRALNWREQALSAIIRRFVIHTTTPCPAAAGSRRQDVLSRTGIRHPQVVPAICIRAVRACGADGVHVFVPARQSKDRAGRLGGARRAGVCVELARADRALIGEQHGLRGVVFRFRCHRLRGTPHGKRGHSVWRQRGSRAECGGFGRSDGHVESLGRSSILVVFLVRLLACFVGGGVFGIVSVVERSDVFE